MKNARTTIIAAVFVGIWFVLIAAATAEWMTSELVAFGLAAALTAIVASLFVLYLDWRERLRRRVRTRAEDYRRAA